MYIGIQFSGYKLFCEESTLEFDKITIVNDLNKLILKL